MSSPDSFVHYVATTKLASFEEMTSKRPLNPNPNPNRHRQGAYDVEVLRQGNGYFVEVMRKSVHNCVGGRTQETPAGRKCVGGFGRERDGTGYYHFVRKGSGIFLRVGMPVMDYTCPSWVIDATSHFREFRLPPTGARYRWPQANSSNVFDRPLSIKCVGNWCTPAAACARAMSGAFDAWEGGERINEPAFWKSDPPLSEHGLRRRLWSFGTVIQFWAGHDQTIRMKCMRAPDLMNCMRNSPKVLVDFRRYGISDASYQNGSHMIACPPGHFYHVAHKREMQPCACVENRPYLNCDLSILNLNHSISSS